MLQAAEALAVKVRAGSTVNAASAGMAAANSTGPQVVPEPTAVRASTAASQVRSAWRLALQRSPTATEEAAATAFLETRSLTELCRVIFNLNEFIYLD